ncbi:hypothetical protein BDB00DRAFT_872813 [Zychaea mexicana]|uniref:uncharacterized protein n=1 Tax=Zychaea mexicana TaxID=64656 RepID=UPI0022FE9342|nr:uncharacterized protein BDB00DRAFT_872813 [Zychaea mexicana]KAI9492959.1 hypothetical protein BDB00DRAFT_872813 [Zychaea mexicana]
MVSAQGVSPTGEEDGTAIMDAAKKLKAGDYVFKSAVGKKYLTLISDGNLVTPESSKHPRIWDVRQHDTTKYFSAHGFNKAGNEKCISTRWNTGDGDGGFPDAAVLWQCEVDTKMPEDTGGYEKIYPPKQLWLAVPDPKYHGYYKIISASHLYDMIPRCIELKKISGGTKLTECKLDTDKKSLLWKIHKI